MPNGSDSLPLPAVTMDARAEPIVDSAEAEAFYAQAIGELNGTQIPFLVAGTFALSAYTGIARATKDLDIFCRAGDWPRILGHFQARGERVQVEDERWLGKVLRGRDFFDVIFASSNGTMPVSDRWFEHARKSTVLGHDVRLVGPTELIWSKCFVQNRYRYDGADVAHLILRAHDEIDWKRLLEHMEPHWEVLLIHLLNFRWIYPSERECIPAWLIDELLDRLDHQRRLPPPEIHVCRGRMFSAADYEIDISEWGFTDMSAEGGTGKGAKSR